MDESLENTRSLVKAAQTGDRAALESLFGRYLPRVRHMVALRMGRRLAECEGIDDCVQETMAEAFCGLPEFEVRSEGAFSGWLAQLAVNNMRDRARRTAALKRGAGRVQPLAARDSSFLADSFFAGREPTPSQVAGGHEMEERIEAALLSLRERYRRVFELRRLAGMSFEEIAEEMGLGAASSARALFARAMNKLSAAVEDANP